MQLTRSGTPAILWDWDREHIESIGAHRCNRQFLPDYPLPDGAWFALCISLCVVGTVIMIAADAFARCLEPAGQQCPARPSQES